MLDQIFRKMLWVLGTSAAFGQTAVDLRTQSKNVDFSAAVSTRPLQTGTALPATCLTGQMFFLSAAAAGSNVYGCTATNIWTVEGGGSGTSGGSGGAGIASQLQDLLVSQSTSTTLMIGAACATGAGCKVRVGTQVYTINAPGMATISAGSGIAYVYISSTGVLTVGHNLTVTCSGCTAQSGVTGFPIGSIPLFIWTATNGAWNSGGGTDERAFLSTHVLGAGSGLQLTETPGQDTLATDPSVVGLRVAAPASSSASCVTGTWAVDTSYYYVCVNTNTWLRAALSAF